MPTPNFQTVRSEGGLLPPDLLRRIADAPNRLPGTSPGDYNLTPGDRLNEIITQSWNRLRRHWTDFRTAARSLPDGEPAAKLTSDRWTLPLLRELGFGIVPTSPSPVIGERTWPINRFFATTAIHLIGCGLSLDRRSTGPRTPGANPHGLVQEFLNRSPDHLWAILTNGLRFRILRDNQALSRQSFLEFDLEAMFTGEVFSDFVLLWLTSHATRFTPQTENRAESCWLEQWTKTAAQDGTRALEKLQAGVEKALQILGEAFVSHPRNTALRESLRSGELPLNTLHEQLLRVVYRLLFLFVAEDRTLDGNSLLHPIDTSDTAAIARERYARHYSTSRLRTLASTIKGSRHGDLWEQFNLIVAALHGSDEFAAVREQLALAPLGSLLWNPQKTSFLNSRLLGGEHAVELSNADFLDAIRNLAFTTEGKLLRPVDYKNLGAEELGGVYTSLLALTPQINADGTRFTFAEFAGNARKTSGSYYTPDCLVQCLLDSALDPVVDEAIKGKSAADAEQAILKLKVCDPSVGSGHFLVGAAHRLARHLARVRAWAQGDSEPSPLLYQQALRDVISRCLYGVDINPMAVELCRINLWLEALEPGKPLSFLDHHIQVGNSLLGTTPALLEAGIPDDAFTPIEGDVKTRVTALKKQNKKEREEYKKGQGYLFDVPIKLGNLAAALAKIDQAPDDTAAAIQQKERHYAELVNSTEYQYGRLLADLWCAAFVWKKDDSDLGKLCPTERDFRKVESHAAAGLLPHVRVEVERLRNQYQLFHWHLAFPDVFQLPRNNEQLENEPTGWSGGFDVVLGNPPWDQLQIDPREFFAATAPNIAIAETTAKRNKLIASLELDNPNLHREWISEVRRFEGVQCSIHAGGRFPLSSVGRLNSAPLFTELNLNLVNRDGRVGTVVPSGIATDSFCQYLFARIVESNALISLSDFENRAGLFPAVDSRMKFCLLTTGSPLAARNRNAIFAFFAHRVEELQDPERRFSLSPPEIAALNPNTKTCSIFRSSRDAELTKSIYRRMPILQRDAGGDQADLWGFVSRLLLMSNTDSHLFEKLDDLLQQGFTASGPVLVKGADSFLPLYEAKMFQMYDHRASDVVISEKALKRQAQPCEISTEDHCNPQRFPQPRFWVRSTAAGEAFREYSRGWYVAVTKVTSATNARTFVAGLLPRFPSTDSSFAMLLTSQEVTPDACAAFYGNVCGFVFDYVARQKLGGVNMLAFIQKQLPVLPPSAYAQWCPWTGPPQKVLTHEQFILPRVLELTYTAWDLEQFARDCGYNGPPFRWDEERRFLLRAELDAAFFHLYLRADKNGDWIPAQKADGCPHDESPEDLARLKASFPKPRDAVSYIMDTFPIVRRKDEEKYNGDYRTKRVILEIYDALQNATRTGQPYQTPLNPPPGPPSDPLPEWPSGATRPETWPPHVHAPRNGR